MSRVQLSPDVDDLDGSVASSSEPFGVEPAMRRHGHVSFAVADRLLELVLLEPGSGGSIDHLGVEVVSSHTVRAPIACSSGAGLFTEGEVDTTCCFATQDGVWVSAPDQERWEVYTVLAGSATFGTMPAALTPGQDGGACCSSTAQAVEPRTSAACRSSATTGVTAS